MKHLDEHEMILLYYREPDAPIDAEKHLAECPRCRTEFSALAETLNACLDWTVPAPPLDFGRSVWAQLAPRLPNRAKPVHPIRIWMAAAAALLLLAGAFVAGRSSRAPEQPLTTGLSPQARARILAITMADHLDRAELLLTEIENSDSKDSAGFATERDRARDLVHEGRLMRQMVAGSGKTNLLPLLDDIERFVLEVANAPDAVPPGDVAALKQRIGSDSLLFKVRIIESNLRTQGQRI
ncbi:MAG TPA: hypothetical protein VG273_00600 [Bryobacteraceae bacterium]|jgi:hypothetical protein|nr:hypothetical protein [Bryobacteraceae bacterium]